MRLDLCWLARFKNILLLARNGLLNKLPTNDHVEYCFDFTRLAAERCKAALDMQLRLFRAQIFQCEKPPAELSAGYLLQRLPRWRTKKVAKQLKCALCLRKAQGLTLARDHTVVVGEKNGKTTA